MLIAILTFQNASAADLSVRPNAALAPEQVVKIIVEALQVNDDADDRGIATVFRFASPANKASTGPLSRFRTMIHLGFSDMLNHRSARYDVMEIHEDVALQVVWLGTPSGRENGYAFKLGRQRGGELDGAWMTDAVIPLGPSSRSGLRI